MPNIQDKKIGEKFQCLVFAPYKAGKTWGAGTFPRPNFIDFDEGINTLLNPEFIKKYGRRSVFYEQFKEKNLDVRGVAKTHNAFDDACRYFDACMKADVVDTFDTWVIDSGTMLSEFAATKAMILLGGSDFGKPLSLTHSQAKKTGLVIPKIQDFGAERSMVEQFVDMIKSSGKNVVLLCHEKVQMDDEGITRAITPLLTGKSAEAIPLKFDEVYYLKVTKEGMGFKRKLQTQPDSIVRCGSRLGVPDGTPWEWDAIQAALRLAQTVTAPTLLSVK